MPAIHVLQRSRRVARLVTARVGFIAADDAQNRCGRSLNSREGFGKSEGTVPPGCSFWSLGVQGRSFHTVPSDHFNCPIGVNPHAACDLAGAGNGLRSGY
jgi:hypothetical protein